MSEDRKGTAVWLAVGVIAVAVLLRLCGGKGQMEQEARVERDTVVVHDTVTVVKPVAVSSRPLPPRVEYLPMVRTRIDTVAVGDTVMVAVEVPMEQKHYGDSLYEAWVSGYRPSLDSLRLHRTERTVTERITIPCKPRRWGLGVQVGAGYGRGGLSPYIGVGVSYNVINW